jgi:hypothetical protein
MKAVIYFKGNVLSKQHATGRFGNHYFTKPKHKEFREALGWESAAQLRRQGWIRVEEEPVYISIQFRAGKNLGDISNLLGGIEDALNGLAWADDCQALLRNCYGIITPGQAETEITIILENFEGDGPVAEGIRAWVLDGLKRRRRKNAG